VEPARGNARDLPGAAPRSFPLKTPRCTARVVPRRRRQPEADSCQGDPDTERAACGDELGTAPETCFRHRNQPRHALRRDGEDRRLHRRSRRHPEKSHAPRSDRVPHTNDASPGARPRTAARSVVALSERHPARRLSLHDCRQVPPWVRGRESPKNHAQQKHSRMDVRCSVSAVSTSHNRPTLPHISLNYIPTPAVRFLRQVRQTGRL